MVCVKVVQTRLVGWTNNVVEKETRMVEQEPKNDNGLILYGIRVEKAYRYIPWGELEIVGVHTKTGRYESMSFEDPITRWKVEKELKNAGIPIENVFLNFYY